jgi:hypothetical protein
MTTVKNINGTSDNKCKCQSWLNHWENFGGAKVQYCSERFCLQTKDLLGAHVQKATSDMKWYIIPLCPTHNKVTGELTVSDSTIFVSANRSETCEK